MKSSDTHTHTRTHLDTHTHLARSALCVVGANPHLILKFEGVEDNFCTTCHSHRAAAAAAAAEEAKATAAAAEDAKPAAAPFIECSHIKIFYGEARKDCRQEVYPGGLGMLWEWGEWGCCCS